MDWFSTISLALGSAWTSGINLYATVTILGLLQKFGFAKLPGGLDALDNWWIIGIAGFLYAVEFFADKIPYLDSVWDVIHTFIRIPAGAIVAYAATNHLDPSITIIATLLGGSLALTSHGTKAAMRGIVNISPEPVSNWVLSITEDIVAFSGVLLSVFAPVVILIVLAVFVGCFIWLFPKVIRAMSKLFRAAFAVFS